MLSSDKNQPVRETNFGEQKIYRGADIMGRCRASDFFYQFWLGLAEGGHKPARKDFKPYDLKPFLDRVVLMDCLYDEKNNLQLVIKLIGTHVAGYYGELGGKPLDTMGNPGAVRRIYKASETVIAEAAPILTQVPGFADDKQFMEATALYLPLFSDTGDVHKIMVCVDVKSMNL